MFAIVPLCTWAATGRLKDAWRAAKGYALVLGILMGVALVFVVIAGIGSVPQ